MDWISLKTSVFERFMEGWSSYFSVRFLPAIYAAFVVDAAAFWVVVIFLSVLMFNYGFFEVMSILGVRGENAENGRAPPDNREDLCCFLLRKVY
jgi:hypothetical protein